MSRPLAVLREWRVPQVLLHPWRRRHALARIDRLGVPRTILVVCFGNICRSAYAALVLPRLLPAALRARVRVTSAGFYGHGQQSPQSARECAGRRGIDLTSHRSRRVTGQTVRRADLVLVMDREQQRRLCRDHGRTAADTIVLGDLDPGSIETRAIRDPYGQPPSVFEQCFERIDRCLAVLAQAITANYQPAAATRPPPTANRQPLTA